MCEDCGQEWPCGPGKDRLRAEAGGDLVALRVLMWGHFDDFCMDAPAEVLDQPFGQVYGRFIGWTREDRWQWNQHAGCWVVV